MESGAGTLLNDTLPEEQAALLREKEPTDLVTGTQLLRGGSE
jgi:hypothetical protein